MYQEYNKTLETLKVIGNTLYMYINDKTYNIDLRELKKRNVYCLNEFQGDNQLIAEFFISEIRYYLYCYNNQLFISNKPDFENIFKYNIEVYNPYLEIKQNNFNLEIKYINSDKLIAIVENVFTTKTAMEKLVDINIPIEIDKQQYTTIAKVRVFNLTLFLIYDDYLKTISFKKYILNIESFDSGISYSINEDNKLSISLKEIEEEIHISSIPKAYAKRIFNLSKNTKYNNKNILDIIKINEVSFYLFKTQKGIHIIKGNPKKVTKVKSNLKPFKIKNHLYLFGMLTYNAKDNFEELEYLYALNKDNFLSKFTRLFKNIKFLKRFGYFKIPIDKLDLEDRVHYPVFLGNKHQVISRLDFSLRKKVSKVYSRIRLKDKLLVLRSDIYNNITYSIVPFSEMYKRNSLYKMKLAYYISKFFYKNKGYNLNLFFEKQASKADESGYRLFEKVKEEKGNTSKNVFILDESSSSFKKMKQKYKSDLIKRFSFKHYLSIFNADYFLSSDLSNHVINDRIYINEIMEKVKDVPLIFLQHGIMFAKPVENPLGKIFYKDYSQYNIYKNVVNSKLEAQEFYKMGYSDKDLFYTGLATFDYAKLDKTSNKIVYMPTYRYWEEGMIYNGDIEKTTYFQSILKVILAFEKANMKNRLVVVSHNKFAEYINESLSDYSDLIAPNPSEALKVGRIFITDYSSAIYDAIYRGAYPIFYWEDKEYLIQKYEANPPVNEQNAPGKIAYSIESLIEEVIYAEENNYKVSAEHKEKYLKINAFNDNKNTQRIIEHLKSNDIL